MALQSVNLSNGATSNGNIFRLLGVLVSGSGIMQSGALLVAAQDTPDMTVKVAGASTGHDAVLVTNTGETYHGWNTADENVTITSNGTGITQIDTIVAYIDLAGGSSTADNPDGFVLAAVRGTDGAAPTSNEIETAIGASNPYIELADVSVANGAVSINSGNITDVRTQATISQSLSDDLVTLDNIASEAWTAYTPTLAAATSNPEIGNGTIEGRYQKIGLLVHVEILIVIGSTTTLGSGQWRVGLPVDAVDSGIYDENVSVGIFSLRDAGNRDFFGEMRISSIVDASAALLYYHVVNGTTIDTGAMTGTAPVTLGNTDNIRISLTYEATE